MHVQFFLSLKVKYPKFFSARLVSRYAWIDVRYGFISRDRYAPFFKVTLSPQTCQISLFILEYLEGFVAYRNLFGAAAPESLFFFD